MGSRNYLILMGVAAMGVLVTLPGDVLAQEVTFTRDVAPILQENCQQCHQPNSIAPMSLITF